MKSVNRSPWTSSTLLATVAFKEKCVDMAVPFDRMHIIVAFIPARLLEKLLESGLLYVLSEHFVNQGTVPVRFGRG